MDLSFLSEYAIPVIIGICLCIGFVIKQSLSFIQNKYIPLIMAVLGLVLNVWLNQLVFTPEIVLGGLFSGLTSTGFYELFHNLLEKGVKK